MDSLQSFESQIASLKKAVIEMKGESVFKSYENEVNIVTSCQWHKGISNEK